MNILLTGQPKSGKSTLLRKLISNLPNTKGLLADELLDKDGNRVGFEVVTSEGHKETVAHIDFDKDISVGKYGLLIENLNKVLPSVAEFDDEILYIDEVGQMQMHSDQFKNLVIGYLDANNLCIATVSAVYEDDFIGSVKSRNDVRIVEISPENRDEVFNKLLQEIKLTSAIGKSWSAESSFLPEQWSSDNPARGQCAVTALVVQDYLGGEIIKCDVIGDDDSHFYNKLPDETIADLTRSQFDEGVSFESEKVADREKMLSYPGTQERYALLKAAVSANM
ncbi:MAG: nucleoside-triphosphatase [Leptolyngbyaceae bacterium]|nr:nucleoside-triphosphatase [Leptolyngbyaceae bacterium]